MIINIKVYFTVPCDGVHLIELAWVRVHWRNFVNEVKPRFPNGVSYFLAC
jgi:hypothetical protein